MTFEQSLDLIRLKVYDAFSAQPDEGPFLRVSVAVLPYQDNTISVCTTVSAPDGRPMDCISWIPLPDLHQPTEQQRKTLKTHLDIHRRSHLRQLSQFQLMKSGE